MTRLERARMQVRLWVILKKAGKIIENRVDGVAGLL